MSTIEGRVREVAEQIVLLSEDADLSLRIDEMGLDSLDTTEFVMEIEEEFNLTIDEVDFQKWVTLKDVVKYVEEKVDG